MPITAITLKTHALAAIKAFYAHQWGLSILRDAADSVQFQVGAGVVRFEADDTREWRYHYAFNIAPNHLDAAETWLQHFPMLTHQGDRRIAQSDFWNADSLYYLDPAGNIGELIARHRLPRLPAANFVPNQHLSLSEIGIPTKDVSRSVALLNTLGLPNFGEASENFGVVGDDHGLLIIVKKGRIWFPQTGVPADCAPVAVTISHAGHTLAVPLDQIAL